MRFSVSLVSPTIDAADRSELAGGIKTGCLAHRLRTKQKNVIPILNRSIFLKEGMAKSQKLVVTISGFLKDDILQSPYCSTRTRTGAGDGAEGRAVNSICK